jgi:hypothetical protein
MGSELTPYRDPRIQAWCEKACAATLLTEHEVRLLAQRYVAHLGFNPKSGRGAATTAKGRVFHALTLETHRGEILRWWEATRGATEPPWGVTVEVG